MKYNLNKLIIFLLILGIISCIGYVSLAKNNISQEKSMTLVQKQEEYLFPIEVNGKYGYINKSGKEVIKPQFDEVQDFSEGLAAVKIGDKWGFSDIKGNVIIKTKFDTVNFYNDGLALVINAGEYEFIDKTGNAILYPDFDEILGFSEGLAAVRKKGKWGYINKKGIIVIKPQFDYAQDFRDGLAYVEINDNKSTGTEQPQKFGYIDKFGKFVPIKVENILQYRPYNTLSCKYIDKDTKNELDPEKLGYPPVRGIEGECPSFSEGLLMVYYNKNNNIGFIDKRGGVKVQTQLRWSHGDMPPIENFKDGLTTFSIRDKWGFMDKNGKSVIENKFTRNVCGSPYSENELTFHNGLATAGIQYNKSTKCGYINKNGNYIWSHMYVNNN